MQKEYRNKLLPDKLIENKEQEFLNWALWGWPFPEKQQEQQPKEDKEAQE